MAAYTPRGLEPEQEVSASRLARDIRPMGERFGEWAGSAQGAVTLCGMAAAAAMFVPALAEISAVVGAWAAWYGVTRHHTLPFRLPQHSGELDYNDPHPATGAPSKASGIFFLGNRRKNGQELWFKKSDVCTHFLVFGTTGAGKTESLVSMAYNSLVQGGGFMYVDGKGDSALWSKVYAIARYMGREDDLLVINYMTGNRDMFKPGITKISNTLNPFATGSSSTLVQLLTSLMDDSGSGGGGDMWKGRAIAMISAIIPALCWLRDEKGWLIDVGKIREYIVLERVLDLRLDYQKEMPLPIQESLKAYCESLAGWSDVKYFKKNANIDSDSVRDQHGYCTMQFTRTLGSLSDDYGYIFKTQLAEIDFYDVVVNRRILLVLLPALEKSLPELGNLGKIIVAMQKSMMATSLGATLEGDYESVIEAKPTNADSPFVAILDEYGYYAVKGAAVMPAQARSLNFQMVFAGQDYPAFKKASEEEAASTVACCNIKIFMKVEDPTDTAELFEKLAGEAYVTHTGGFQSQTGGLMTTYMDTQSASVEKRARGNLLDLKAQKEGEAHVMFGSSIIRTKMFYANPPKPKNMRLNHFLGIEPPGESILNELSGAFDRLRNALLETRPDFPKLGDEFNVISESYAYRSKLSSVDSGIAALIDYGRSLEDLLGGPKEALGDPDQAFDAEVPVNLGPAVPVAPVLSAKPLEMPPPSVISKVAASVTPADLGVPETKEAPVNVGILTPELDGMLSEMIRECNSSTLTTKDQVAYIESLMGGDPDQATEAVEVYSQQLMTYPEQVPPHVKPEVVTEEFASVFGILNDLMADDK